VFYEPIKFCFKGHATAASGRGENESGPSTRIDTYVTPVHKSTHERLPGARARQPFPLKKGANGVW